MNGLIRSTIAGSVLLMAMSLAVTAQNPQNSQSAKGAGDESRRILSLENAWNQAEANHDVPALSMLIADTFANTDDDGSFTNRDRWLARVRNEVDQYEQLANTGMTVQLYGDAAIVTGNYHERIKVKGNPVMRSGRFTDTWIRQSVGWKCVASQSTLTTR